MAPRLFEQKKKETLWNFLLKNFFGRVYSPRLTTGNSAKIYRYLSNKPGGGGGGTLDLSSRCLLFKGRHKKSKGTQYYFKPIQWYYLYSFLYDIDILMKHDDYIDISQITSALKT